MFQWKKNTSANRFKGKDRANTKKKKKHTTFGFVIQASIKKVCWAESIGRAWDMGGLASRRPWISQGPWFMDPRCQAQNDAEVVYFEKRRGINGSKDLGPIRAIIME